MRSEFSYTEKFQIQCAVLNHTTSRIHRYQYARIINWFQQSPTFINFDYNIIVKANIVKNCLCFYINRLLYMCKDN